MTDTNPLLARRIATDEQQALLAMPPLLDSFPVTVGEYTWHKFDVGCIVCKKPIEREHLHGRVDLSEPEMALVDAIGFCPSCGVHSTASFGLNDAGVLLVSKDGQWQTQEVKTSFWNDISKSLEL